MGQIYFGDQDGKWVSFKSALTFKLAQRASKRLELVDLFDICGEQETYTMVEAKRLHKMQWRAKEYEAAQDVEVNGERRVSQGNMLEILRLRSRYIAERGSTLNNPKITAAHLRRFKGTDRDVLAGDWAASIRKIATEFAKAHPDHPSITVLRPAGGE